MMIDVFALLTEARQRVVSTTSGVGPSDFWLAAVDLAAILGGRLRATRGGSSMSGAPDAGQRERRCTVLAQSFMGSAAVLAGAGVSAAQATIPEAASVLWQLSRRYRPRTARTTSRW